MKSQNTIFKFALFGLFILVSSFFSNCKSSTKDNTNHLKASMEYFNEGAKILNKNGSYETLDNQSMETIIKYNKLALKEAKLVNIKILNERYNGFGDHYNAEFVKGIEMFISGYEDNDDVKFLKGQVLIEQWGTWYSDNVAGIKKGK